MFQPACSPFVNFSLTPDKFCPHLRLHFAWIIDGESHLHLIYGDLWLRVVVAILQKASKHSILHSKWGTCGGAVGWGTALQTGRSRVRFPIVSLEFFIDIILPAALWPWGRLSLWEKWVPQIFPGVYRRPVRMADKLSTFMCQLSWNLGASTTWKPQGLSRPVMELLYLYKQN
jgi:hypothetical protein